MEKKTAVKKTLIITSLEGNHSLWLSSILKKPLDELLFIHSYGSFISQSYGCIIRSIIMAAYYENVEDVYVIGVEVDKESKIHREGLLLKMEEAGVTGNTLHTLDYIRVVEKDIISWLTGPEDMKEVIKKNIDLIERHPLMPKTINVQGFITAKGANTLKAI
ncbi:carbonic anhydrase [Alkalihalophilus marmarensis]|uniref:hypothetical protein n=1 Tax=Alkalihalophilus marmarensis TaxID=521377 RepID=UPI002DBFDA9D|nr:hypothetical protein [Alkalihalophilus marmarensis]MEC2071094.1 hypothetical protein [Alkalihalophilus marmarensis]